MRTNLALWMLVNGWLALATTNFDDPLLFCLLMVVVNGVLLIF